MPSVKASLGLYLAVAAVSAPSMLPILEVHVTCEGENILNLQIEGLREFFLPNSDAVFPCATDTSADAKGTDAYA